MISVGKGQGKERRRPARLDIKTRFHNIPALAEHEMQAIKAGLVYTEVKENDGFMLKGKSQK